MQRASRSRLGLAVMLAVVFATGLVPRTIAPAQAADATIVFASYRAIMAHHIRRQDPLKLLAAALNGLREALREVGIQEPLPSLAGRDEATASAEFQARFDQAVRLAQRRVPAIQLQYAAAGAMAASVGDSATSFETPTLWYHDNHGFGKGLAGIGTYFNQMSGRFVILTVAPYSAGQTAGLRRFDRIVAVDGHDLGEATIDDLRHRLFFPGGEGTKLTVTIRRPGVSTPLTFSMVRQRVLRFPPVEHRMLAGHLGYIWIRSLVKNNDAAEFRRALVDLQRDGLHGLILDLRVHEGGDLQVLYVANALLPAGVAIQQIVSDTHDLIRPRRDACPMPARADRVELVRAGTLRMPSSCTDTTSGGALLDPSTPLVVLIDENTWGSGELLSAVIQGTRRGRLLGTRTPGVVGWADWVNLPGGTGIKVESHVVLAGNGAVVDRVGVRPDVTVELTGQDLDRGADTQLQRAVELLSR